MSPTTTPERSAETPSTSADAAVDGGTPRFARLRGSLQQFLAAASLIVIVVFFSFASSHFFTANNLVSILTAATVTGILALGTTFVIITGGIDLSIGTGMVLCGVMAGVFLTYWGWPLWAGVLATILFGGLIGLVNGVNISVLGHPAVHRDPRHDAHRRRAGARHLGHQADLLQRHPRVPVDHEPLDHPRASASRWASPSSS